MATIANIVIDQGTTFSYTITLENPDGSAKDLSLYTVTAQMRKSFYTSSKVDFTVDTVDETGELTISLTATQTQAIKAGRYVYDIEAASSDETLRLLEGIITVTPEVTR